MADQGKQGKQKGATTHGIDQHGPKAYETFIDGLHGRHGGSEESEGAPQGSPYSENESDGRHRLREDRQQHDAAEKNSDANKAAGVDRDSGPIH
jgi:hypothetical protein